MVTSLWHLFGQLCLPRYTKRVYDMTWQICIECMPLVVWPEWTLRLCSFSQANLFCNSFLGKLGSSAVFLSKMFRLGCAKTVKLPRTPIRLCSILEANIEFQMVLSHWLWMQQVKTIQNQCSPHKTLLFSSVLPEFSWHTSNLPLLLAVALSSSTILKTLWCFPHRP